MKLAILARRAALAVAAALLIPPATAGAAVTVGHSGWTWGNPVPQGNTLRALEFSGGRGYAAGQFGTLLRTDDAGATWTGIPTGLTAELRRIEVISPDSLVIAAECAVRRSDDGGQTFTRLPWTASDQRCASPVAALSFPTSDVGYLALADGNVLRTADGGRSWARRTTVPSPGSMPTDIIFTSADTGTAVTRAGQFFRTTDGGATWTLTARTFDGGSIQALDFISESHGFAVGARSAFYTTDDGGQTWTSWSGASGGGPASDFASVSCSHPTICLVVTAQGGLIRAVLRMDVRSVAATEVTPSGDALHAASFVSDTRAVAVGLNGVTVISNDEGQTWSQVGGRLLGTFTGLRATSSTTAFVFGPDGALARTTDGGQTWANLGAFPSPDEVIDVSFPTNDVGFALDQQGQLTRTDNGGASWAILNTGTSAPPRAVHAFDANTVLLAGPRGVRRSTNGGGEFSPVRDRLVSRARVNRLDQAGSAIFTWQRGGTAAAFSTNRGVRWQRIARLPFRRGVLEYDWISRRVGFALGNDQRVYRTSNGGRTWSELTAVGNTAIRQIAFSSSTRGYLIGDFGGPGVVFRTSDGGRTFRPQVVHGSDLIDIAAPAGGTEFLLGSPSFDPTTGAPGPSALFHTTTGGDQGQATTLALRPVRRRGTSRRRARFVTIQISGRLNPAEGGERIQLSARGNVRGARTQTVTAASNGTFTSTWTVRGTARFVAQWQGDDDRRGAGSRVLTVTPR